LNFLSELLNELLLRNFLPLFLKALDFFATSLIIFEEHSQNQQLLDFDPIEGTNLKTASLFPSLSQTSAKDYAQL